jgi:hypothetical protein
MPISGRILRFPLLILAMLTLLAASWGGLSRMGWPLPGSHTLLVINHGALMISGFFGTLIGLERAVALRKSWAYVGPGFSAAGGLTGIIGIHGYVSPVLLTIGSLWMILVFVIILRRQFVSYTIVMAIGALSWVIGNILWLLGWPVYHIVFWWVGFLVLTIAGERLELGRIMRPRRVVLLLFFVAVGLFLAGVSWMLVDIHAGGRVVGVAILALAVWLLRYDVVRVTIRMQGLARFIAICLTAGYLWLGFSGVLLLLHGGQAAGLLYDAILHTILVGFVFSMVFGHAPIILPAVLGNRLSYHPLLYLPVVILHISLIMRIIGDLLGVTLLRQWGGLFNALMFLLYFLLVVLVGRLNHAKINSLDA